MRAACECNAERQSESVNKKKAGREVEDCGRCVPECLKDTLRSWGGGGDHVTHWSHQDLGGVGVSPSGASPLPAA